MTYLQTEDFTHTLLSPGDLISLAHEDARIPNGAFAMRELNKDHVESLVLSDANTWPDIQVTLCIAGYIVIDGYHRWEAVKIKRLKGFYATCKTYTSENEVVEAAFRANLAHGLKASVETKGDYAFWLHLTYKMMDQTEIAKRAQMTQGAVSKAIAKREAALRTTEEEISPEKQERLIKKSCQRFTRVAINFLTEVEQVDDKELAEMLNAVIKKSEDRARLARIGQLLGDQIPPKTQFARLLKKDA